MSYMMSWLVCILWALHTHGQSLQGAFGEDPICNGTFAQANATGIYSYQPNVNQGPQTNQPNNTSGRTLPLDIAVTISEDRNTSRLFLSTWLRPNGANYSDDFGLGYDICAMALSPFPNNTIARGQSDNGSCTTMFDETCVNDVNTAAEDYASQLTLAPSPGPNTNLTVYSILSVCPDIAQKLNSNPPKSCSKYWSQNSTWIYPTALTGYNASTLYGSDGCVTNVTDDNPWLSILSNSADYSDSFYDENYHSVGPILGIWMPIANADRPSTITYSKAQMRCVRASNVTEDSRVPAALPAATPTSDDGGGLSGGVIAGIVIGVLVAVGLVAGMVVWWLLSERKKAKSAEAERLEEEKADSEPVPMYKDEPLSASTEAPDTAVSELPEDWRRPELDGGKDVTRYELPPDAGVKPVELEGTVPSR